jgi:multimeric flavodoxin WrbA
MAPLKILALNGSPKIDGRTAHMLSIFIKETAKLGAEVTLVNLYKEKIPQHSGELKQPLKKLSKLQQLMVDCDGFVIATPTHWFNLSSQVKLFIDHLTDLEDNDRWLLEGKVAGFIVYSPEGGEAPVLQNLSLTFIHMGVTLPPYSLIYYRGKQDTWVKKDLKLLAKSIIQQIQAQKASKFSW